MEPYKKNKLKEVAKAINELSILCGGTDKHLSDVLGLSATNIWLWKNGHQKFPIKHLEKIRVLFKKKGFDFKRLRPDIYL